MITKYEERLQNEEQVAEEVKKNLKNNQDSDGSPHEAHGPLRRDRQYPLRILKCGTRSSRSKDNTAFPMGRLRSDRAEHYDHAQKLRKGKRVFAKPKWLDNT